MKPTSMNVKNLTAHLLESSQNRSIGLTTDVAIGSQLVKVLPRVFPRPSHLLFRGYPGVECDAVLAYYLKEGEHPEALRMALSLSFLGVQWEIEEYPLSDTLKFNLVSIPASFTDKHTVYVQLAIAGIDPYINDYTMMLIGGTKYKNRYAVACEKFVPFDAMREDMTPGEFATINKESAIVAFVEKRREKALRAFYDFAGEFPPCVDAATAEVGSPHDIEIVYYSDSKGRIRDHLNKVFGPLEWRGSVYKATGAFSTSTTINLPTLAVQVLIINTKPAQDEILTLIDDNPRSLVYTSVRFNESTGRQDDLAV